MKFNKIGMVMIGLCALLSVLAPGAASASLGFDTFASQRTYVLAAPENFVGTTFTVTNGPLDMVKLTGVGKLDLLTLTNTGTTGGTLTASLYSSPDQTNFYAVTNYALITGSTPEYITNLYYGNTNMITTNSPMLPGALVTTSPGQDVGGGFVTPYFSPAQFTNAAAITLNGNKAVTVGLRIDDLYRYLYVVYTPGGTATNFTTSGMVTAPAAFN